MDEGELNKTKINQTYHYYYNYLNNSRPEGDPGAFADLKTNPRGSRRQISQKLRREHSSQEACPQTGGPHQKNGNQTNPISQRQEKVRQPFADRPHRPSLVGQAAARRGHRRVPCRPTDKMRRSRNAQQTSQRESTHLQNPAADSTKRQELSAHCLQ